jgi:hypothetical protein
MSIARALLLLILLLSALGPAQVRAEQDYPPQVKEIVERRCMVCHGCYDAPCQLKLDAWEGLQRGASKDKVYDGTRLISSNLTRLFIDAQTPAQWREKGFYPVLGDTAAGQPGAADARDDVIYRMLQLKERHPLPDGDRLPDSFDLSLDRDQQCPKAEEFNEYADNYPLWGMPYALPGLDEARQQTLLSWLENGAPGVEVAPPSPRELQQVATWERFFNGTSLKQQLMSRYIFEHLFIANLYFRELDNTGRYYRLVRSRTPPGQTIDVIATRRPYESPGAGPLYYRLQLLRSTIVAKRHMPYALDTARLQRWTALFLEPDYEVAALPSYKPEVASNPFVAFQALPQNSRYRFMLDEAQFTIMGYIKGPVCRGQIALNVIDDQFWVFFTDPDEERAQHTAEFLARESGELRLPNADGNLLVSLVQWRKYSKNQLKFLKAKTQFINQTARAADIRVDLELIWDGDGHNDNASLTVFRHTDTATVVKGLVGQQPKTAWLIDYSLLERIHYLLVAGFDVYGNVGHQLETRLYMDFLRMEGEQNFLFLLPKQERIALRDYWYRNAGEHVKRFVMTDAMAFDRDTDIVFSNDSPAKPQLLDMLQQRIYGAAADRYAIHDSALERLAESGGAHLSLMPQVAFVQVFGRGEQERVYSLIHNSAYSNNAQIFQEEERRIPQEDTLTVARGFIGAYPNAFFQINSQDLDTFTDAVLALESEADYAALKRRFGVARNAPHFWQVSDRFHDHAAAFFPRESGVFDLNRYENR